MDRVKVVLAEKLNFNCKLPSVELVPDAHRFFPGRNNHNTPYYSTENVFEPSFCEAMYRVAKTVPTAEKSELAKCNFIYPKSGKCSKCNCLLKQCTAGITLCKCIESELAVTMCIECLLLRWVICACSGGKVRSPLYLNKWVEHPGFAECPRCTMPLTLSDFRKI